MNGRRTTTRPQARVALGAAVTAGIAAVAVGVAGAGTASAHPVSITLNYTCSVYLLSASVPMEIHSDIPDSVAAGKPSPEFILNAMTAVSKDQTHLIRTSLGQLRSIGGTVDANTEVHSPDGDFSVPVHFGITTAAIPESDRAFSITAKGTAPSHTFHRQGNVRITVGDLTVKLNGQKANGQPLGTINAACKLATHPQPVVASFEVTGVGTTTGSPASGASSAGATSGSASAGGSAAPASAGSGTVRGTTANTGQDTRDLMLLAVGTLAAGGGLFLLGFRLKPRRRAGGNR